MGLRIYTGEEQERPQRWTLSEFFERHLLEHLLDEGRKRLTIAEYRGSLRLWEQATRDKIAGTPAPSGGVAVAEIDDDVGKRFTKWLSRRVDPRSGETISANTRRKHVVAIQAVLDRLMPKSRHNPWGSGIVDDVPRLAMPTVVVREVDDSLATREDVQKLRAACETVFGGRGCAPRVQAWRDLYELAFWTGLRLGSLWQVESRWLLDDAISREFGGRWLAVPAGHSKTGRPYKAFLAAAAMPLIDRLDGRLGRWFALVMSSRRFYDHRRELEAAAGIRPQSRGLHAVRKLIGTELAMTSVAAQKLQLGHASGGDVALDHYTGRRVQAEHCSRREPLASEGATCRDEATQ